MKISIVGMAWYRPEHYDAILRIMSDREKFSASYHVWRMNAETGEKRQRRAGQTVVRAYINPETFPDWCRARGLDVDAKARTQFAAIVAREHFEQGYRNDEVH